MIYGIYGSKLAYSALAWIVLVVFVALGWIFCCFNILYLKRERKAVTNNLKTAIAAFLVVIAFFILYLSSKGIA